MPTCTSLGPRRCKALEAMHWPACCVPHPYHLLNVTDVLQAVAARVGRVPWAPWVAPWTLARTNPSFRRCPRPASPLMMWRWVLWPAAAWRMSAQAVFGCVPGTLHTCWAAPEPAAAGQDFIESGAGQLAPCCHQTMSMARAAGSLACSWLHLPSRAPPPCMQSRKLQPKISAAATQLLGLCGVLS